MATRKGPTPRRRTPAPRRKPVTLEAWAHKRVIDVVLDIDLTVKLRLPDIGAWLAQGKIPNPLAPMAARIEYDDIVDLKEMDAEERANFYELQCFILATHLVEPDVMAAHDGDVDKAIAWVLEEVDPLHRHVLWQRALHILPPDAQEVLRSLADLGKFRDGEPSPEPVGDGDGDGQSS
jgi:hypothetical protein